jgi:23S rRNA pseudouridine2605 synthase
MRINKYIAQISGLSRRAADTAIENGRVLVNGQSPSTGQDVTDTDTVTLDGRRLENTVQLVTIMLNKPVGYVCSRDGQGSKTVYDLLPKEYHNLKPVGRLDKDSSGLLLLTNDGNLANQLTHPSAGKQKKYEIHLHKDLTPLHHQMIVDYGVALEDGPSRFMLTRLHSRDNKDWLVTMSEGRNRQIRRTFSALGYTVRRLHRTNFGQYSLGSLAEGVTKLI